MAELITVNLSANEVKQFRKAGSYIEIIDSSYAVGLNFYSVNGSQTNSLKGALSGLFLDIDFGAFDVVNGATAQTVTLLVCDAGELGGSRRQPGNVRVIDQSADQTAALNQFIAMNGVSNGGLGVVAGLWAQTKQITVKAIQFGSNVAGTMQIVTGTGRPINNQGAAPSPANKLIGGAVAASALSVSGTVAGALPVTAPDLAGVTTVGYTSVQAGVLYRIDLKTPILIPVGKFFGFATGVAGASVNFIAEIEE